MRLTRVGRPLPLAVALLAAPVAPAARAQEAPRAPLQQFDNFSMRIGARIQTRYTLSLPDTGSSAGSFAVRRARLLLNGAAYEHFNYAFELELAGPSVRLLDANIRVGPRAATLWFGQGKAFFGRQQLTSSRNLHFVDRGIVDSRFAAGRQIGAAMIGQIAGGALEYNAGIYNGDGPNTANTSDRYLTTARVVWTPLGAYAPVESAHDYPGSPRLALGGAVLNNPHGAGAERVDVTRYNGEAAFRLRGFNATAELYHERAHPAGGEAATAKGWYVQGGYLLPDRRHELAARYAAIQPDTPTSTDQFERGLAYSYYVRGHNAKVQADFITIDRKATATTDSELRVQLQLAF